MKDIDLIRNWQRGDEQAFKTLYERYRRPLYAYLNRLTSGNAHVADDLYQDAWMRAIDHFDSYRENDRFLSWLFRIAHNLAVDHFRRQRTASEELSPDSIMDEQASAAERLDRDVVSKALEDAIRSLNPDQREVVELRRNGLPFKEIAAIQDVSINTVLGRMHYAVARLKNALKPLRSTP